MQRELKKVYITRELGEDYQEEALLEVMLDELTGLYGELVATDLMQYVELDSYEEEFETDLGPIDGEMFIAKYTSTWLDIRLIGYILDQEQVQDMVRLQRLQDERDYRSMAGY